MNTEHQIVQLVYAAKEDTAVADEFIRQYMGFIKAETAKFTHRIPREGQDDELSIAMMALHESALHYEKGRGNFLKYAGRNIRNRLIDYYRREKRHIGLVSLNQPADDGDDERQLLDQYAQKGDGADERVTYMATQEEIREFERQLAEFGLSFTDVAENCPRQKRTLEACHQVLQFAGETPQVLEELVRTKKLPMAKLEQGSGVSRKTLDRHRKYLVAILLAFTNGYEIIRGHLCQIAPKKGGDQK